MGKAGALLAHISETLREIEAEGLTKRERQIGGPQSGRIAVNGREMINLCANNYLGLAHHPEIEAAAKQAIDAYGFGMSSVRFICGTQTLHRELERAIARYLGKDDAILFAACFDANGGIFETLLSADDAIISDSLNHASIIDGVRLSKARRFRFANSDMDELETRLKQAEADGARFKLVVTDGVFSMDGYVAKLPEICALAERYGALVMVDDCHATGHLGDKGQAPQASPGRVTASTSSPAHSARRWAGRWAGSSLPRSRSSTCCGSGRDPICSPIRWPRRLRQGR